MIVGSTAFDSIKTPKAGNPRLLGGSASHAAVAASFFAPVNLAGVGHGDDFPERYLQLFRRHHIDLAGLEIAPGKTFHWSGEYEVNMNNRRTLATELGVLETFMPKLPGRAIPEFPLRPARQSRSGRPGPRALPDAPPQIRRRRFHGPLAQHRPPGFAGNSCKQRGRFCAQRQRSARRCLRKTTMSSPALKKRFTSSAPNTSNHQKGASTARFFPRGVGVCSFRPRIRCGESWIPPAPAIHLSAA